MVADHTIHPVGTPVQIGKAQSLLASMWTAMGELQPVANLEELGWKLFRLAFPDSKSELLFARTLGEMEKAGGNLRLWIDSPSLDLACLPWEYLTVPEDSRELFERAEVTLRSPFLALHSHLTVQRRAPGFDLSVRLRAPGRLKVLVAWTNPKGEWGDVTSVEREAQHVRELLETLGSDFVDFQEIEARSKKALLDAIRTFRPHVLHYNGHGCFPEVEGHLLVNPPEAPSLVLGCDSKAEYLSAAELAQAADGTPLCLVILNCCWGAAGTQFAPSFATELLGDTSIGAVIANQTPIKTALAVSLTSRLYREVAAGKQLDEAIQSYRQHAAVEPRNAHWGVPVIHSRVGDMRLFEKIRLTKGTVDLGPILDRHRPDRIVGRTWLKAKVTRYIEDLKKNQSGGTFLLTAAPGMGKTAFAAKLTRELDGVIPFFYSYRDGIRDPNRFRQHAIREIQTRFGWINERLDFTRDTLRSLMERAGKRSLEYGRMQVLLVDALDESEMSEGLSAAGVLPVRVPPGVCIIALTRPGPLADEIRERYDVEDYTLTADPHNLEDAIAACERLLLEVCPDAWLDTGRTKKLAEEIAGKSGANFLVIRMFFYAREDGTMTVEQIEKASLNLADSVEPIYEMFFARLKADLDREAVEPTYKVLGALATAQAPVTPQMLWSAFALKKWEWEVALVRVRQFLAESLQEGPDRLEALYTTFHESFREYLIREFEPDLQDGHCSWARFCGGWRTQRGGALRYGLQFLPVHLDQCGDREQLFQLLRDLYFAKRRTDLIGPYGYAQFFSGAMNGRRLTHQERKELQAIQRVLDQNTHILAPEPNAFLELMQNGLQQRLADPERVEALTANVPVAIPWLRLNNRPPLGSSEEVLVRTLKLRWGGDRSMAVDWTRGLVVSGSNDNTVKIWDLATGELHRTLEGHTYSVTSVAVDGALGLVVSASRDDTVKIWDLETGKLRRTLEGHTDMVISVVVDGVRGVVVSGSDDRTVKIWDLETGELHRTLEGHADSVNSVAVDGARGLVVSGSDDRTVKIWDLETGELRRTLEGHTYGVSSVAVDEVRGVVVSGSGDDRMKVWDLETGELRRTLEGHTGWVSSVAADGPRGLLVSGSNGFNDNTVKVWDLETGELRRTLEGHADSVNSVAVDGARALVVSASNDSIVKMWDLGPEKLRRTLEGHTREVNSVAVDGTRGAAVSSDDRTVKIWDLETGELRRTLEGHTGWVTSVAVDERRGLVMGGSNDNTVTIWDLETGELRRTLEARRHLVNWVAVDRVRGLVVSGSNDNTVKVWDLETGECRRILEGHTGWVSSVAVDGARGLVVSGSDDRTVKIWDQERGDLRRSLEGHTGWVNSVAVDEARGVVVSGSNDNTVKVWDLETGELRRTLEGHSYGVSSVTVDGALGVVVSGSNDNTVKIWDLETGELRRTLEGHTNSVSSVAVDGALGLVASGSEDRTVKIWDLETGRLRRTLEGHIDMVRSVAVDGARGVVVSGSNDNTVKIWDLETGQLRRTLEGHIDMVRSVVVDGARGVVVSGSTDNTVKVWDLETGELRGALEVHGNSVTSVAVDGSSGVVVGGSNDNTVKIWDLETGEWRRTLEGHATEVSSVAVDGARGVVVSGSYRRVKIWDLETGQWRRTLEGHTSWVHSVAVDGARGVVVSGSDDRTVKIWDLETGELHRTLEGHGNLVTSVAVDGSSGVVVSGSWDNTVKIWDLETGSLLKSRAFSRVRQVATDPNRPGRIFVAHEGEPGVPFVLDFTFEPPRLLT